jgi:hypothetical protein
LICTPYETVMFISMLFFSALRYSVLVCCDWVFWNTKSINTVQVPLFNILKKFDGETVTEVVRPSIARMRYRVTRLPKYLILHMRRFTKNNFFVEKNPTLGEILCSLD